MKLYSLSVKFKLESKLLIIILGFVNITSLVSFAHEGHANMAPWIACQESKLNDICSYKTTSVIYKGSCRSIQSNLMCVRNQPLELIEQVASEVSTGVINSSKIHNGIDHEKHSE